jgi:RHH-type rel operon transcriptional repressor/antitoxin RelB
MLAIRLPPDLEARLSSLAKTTGRTKSYYVREALEEHLADIEDLYLAETRLRKVRSGRARPVPLEKAMKRHGLAG